MCSVVGYIGSNTCSNYILTGLKRLEYRGYDSAGFACISLKNQKIAYNKAQGELSNLIEKQKLNTIDGYSGIGHTRWATHGIASEFNAHPHIDCDQKVAVVHNGIIENYSELSLKLSKTHQIKTTTDTELIAHILEDISKDNLKNSLDFKSIALKVINQLEGAYAFIALLEDYKDTLLVVRKKSPLCIGLDKENQGHFIASDATAFAGWVKKVIFMPDCSFALVKKDYVELYNFSGDPIAYSYNNLENFEAEVNKQGFEHFMLKEIYEQKQAIKKTVDYYKYFDYDNKIWHQLNISIKELKNLKQINLIGCGTSLNAGSIAKYFFENICNIPTQVLLASEIRYNKFFKEPNSLNIAISQSGETADTLEAIRFLSNQNLKTIALTNVSSSSMTRECDGFVLTKAGKEVSVASTKAFSTQLTALYYLANRIALDLSLIDSKEFTKVEQDLLIASQVLESSIETYKSIIDSKLALKYSKAKQAIFLGRNISYPFAKEAALKLKEISYIFTDCYPAGELKHGSIALVSDSIPVFIFSCLDKNIYQKLVSNAQEVKARGANLIIFAFEDQIELIKLADTCFVFPRVNSLLAPLAMTGLMQFFAYSIAKCLDRPIDKPRNLAKSVTVE